MKQQYTLTELAQRLETLENQKRDFVLDTRNLEYMADSEGASLIIGDEQFGINDIAHGQICNNLGVPKKYYDRMRADAPGLLMDNVNHWLQHEPSKRMVRALSNGTNTARAWLSDRYRRIDNYAIAQAALPVLSELPDVRIESTALTDKNMFIKAVLPQVQAEVNVGDVVQAGISIRNSEVGHGAVTVGLFVYRLVCKNSMTVPVLVAVQTTLAATSKPRKMFTSCTAMKLCRRPSIAVNTRKVRGAANDLRFKRVVDKMREAANSSRIDDPVGTVEELGAASLCQSKSKRYPYRLSGWRPISLPVKRRYTV